MTTSECRRSCRVRKKRDLSPEEDVMTKKTKTSQQNSMARRAKPKSKKPADAEKEAEFCCDLCQSPYIVNPGRRGNRPKTSNARPSPRRRNDPKTGRMLSLCNACGLAFDKPAHVWETAKDAGPDDRRQHEERMQSFALSMVQLLGDQEATNLCCPAYTKKPCLCLQSYIRAPGLSTDESRTRAVELLRLFQEAKRLRSHKFNSEEESQQLGTPKRRVSGLGTGQRRSKAYEGFVLKTRKELRQEAKLCERATQRILGYSNNFLHKKLKTDPQKRERIQRTKGKGALGLLRPISELSKLKCCMDRCCVMAHSYGQLIKQWRERVSVGQAEARRVLAEMLTPSGGSRCNCYRFISWVTGCSHSTISKVSEQMKKTGGSREPPPHRLKQRTKVNPKRSKVSIRGEAMTLQSESADEPPPVPALQGPASCFPGPGTAVDLQPPFPTSPITQEEQMNPQLNPAQALIPHGQTLPHTLSMALPQLLGPDSSLLTHLQTRETERVARSQGAESALCVASTKEAIFLTWRT